MYTPTIKNIGVYNSNIYLLFKKPINVSCEHVKHTFKIYILKGRAKDERNNILKWHANYDGFLPLSANIWRQSTHRGQGSWSLAAVVNLSSNCFANLRYFSGWLLIRFGNHCFISYCLPSTLPFLSWQNHRSSASISFCWLYPAEIWKQSSLMPFFPLSPSTTHLPYSGKCGVNSSHILLWSPSSWHPASIFLPVPHMSLHSRFPLPGVSFYPLHLADPYSPLTKPRHEGHFLRGTFSDHCPVYFLKYLGPFFMAHLTTLFLYLFVFQLV